MSKKTSFPQGGIRPFGGLDKLGYSLGDMGCGFSFQLVSTFMQLFYMQYIGVTEEAYAVIILLSKIFDAVNDIVIGNLVDTKKIGRKNSILFGVAILTAAFFSITFFNDKTPLFLIN